MKLLKLPAYAVKLLTVQKLSAVLAVVLIASIGTYLLGASHAATSTSSAESEAGILNGSATLRSDSAASGGSAVQFGQGGPVFGVLNANVTHLQTDNQAGIRLAEIDVGWDDWESTDGSYDTSYQNQIVAAVAAYRAAGWQVAISPGLQYPPGWVDQLTNGQLVDQNGNGSGSPNYEFNQAVRSATAAYLTNLVTTLGPSNITYYRVGLSTAGEMLYASGANSNQWWAFDNIAQGKDSGLPSGVGVSPMPGWIPGTTTWNGETVTAAQVQSWYNWYSGALNNAHAWEISTYRAAGYHGLIQLVMPGDGAGPHVLTQRLAADLAPESYDGANTLATGTAWQNVLNALPDLSNTVIDISSVDDNSGTSTTRDCQASDNTVSLANADTWVSHWSSTRWITYLAAQHGLKVVGENPGSNVAGDLPNIFSLLTSCHLTALQWAFDNQLYDGTHASISDYSAQITATK